MLHHPFDWPLEGGVENAIGVPHEAFREKNRTDAVAVLRCVIGVLQRKYLIDTANLGSGSVGQGGAPEGGVGPEKKGKDERLPDAVAVDNFDGVAFFVAVEVKYDGEGVGVHASHPCAVLEQGAFGN